MSDLYFYERLRVMLEKLEEARTERRISHYTIFRFSAGWKVVFQVPGNLHDYSTFLADMPTGRTLADAIEWTLEHEPNFYNAQEDTLETIEHLPRSRYYPE